MSTFNANAYGPPVAALLEGDRLPVLGPGTPNGAVRRQLEILTPQSLVAPRPLRDRDMAAACLSGLWLLHDFLDESHRISQEIKTPTGSYWHGIMHRREPDYDNARYWFRRVGKHPVFEPLHVAAVELAGGAGVHPAAKFLRTSDRWDPFAFVDLCQTAATGKGPLEMLCRKVQQREWELLFDWCYRQATG
jgi:hypothetical protein